jgi:hypothetical protein
MANEWAQARIAESGGIEAQPFLETITGTNPASGLPENGDSLNHE